MLTFLVLETKTSDGSKLPIEKSFLKFEDIYGPTTGNITIINLVWYIIPIKKEDFIDSANIIQLILQIN